MNRFVRLIAISCAIMLFASCAKSDPGTKVPENSPQTIEKTVVSVNGIDYNLERFNLYFYNAQDEILKAAGFNKASKIPEDFWDSEVNGRTMLDMARSDALDLLIADSLEYQKASEYGLELTAEDRSAINNQMSALKQDKVSLAQFEYIGISVDELEAYYKEEMLMSPLVAYLISEKIIKLDPEVVANAFYGNYYKFKHIFWPTMDSTTKKKLSDDTIEYSRKKSNEVMDRLAEGQEFDYLMEIYSKDPYLYAYPDGYVVLAGEWEEDVEELLFSMEEGEISPPVESSDGIHIFMREELDPAGLQERDALAIIEEELAIPHLEELVKTWRTESDIVVYDDVIEDIKPTIVRGEQMSDEE